MENRSKKLHLTPTPLLFFDFIIQQLFLQLQSAFKICFWINSHCSNSLNLNKFSNDSKRKFSCKKSPWELLRHAWLSSPQKIFSALCRQIWGSKGRLLIFSATTFNKDIIFCALEDFYLLAKQFISNENFIKFPFGEGKKVYPSEFLIKF